MVVLVAEIRFWKRNPVISEHQHPPSGKTDAAEICWRVVIGVVLFLVSLFIDMKFQNSVPIFVSFKCYLPMQHGRDYPVFTWSIFLFGFDRTHRIDLMAENLYYSFGAKNTQWSASIWENSTNIISSSTRGYTVLVWKIKIKSKVLCTFTVYKLLTCYVIIFKTLPGFFSTFWHFCSFSHHQFPEHSFSLTSRL